jgi:hypothetical protein
MTILINNEYWLSGYNAGMNAERALHVNPQCVWGQGECTPSCPSCKVMDDLWGEWWRGHSRGFDEGYIAATSDFERYYNQYLLEN